MPTPGGSDNLHFSASADFAPARREVKALIDDLNRLGTQARTTGGKLDSGAREAASNYRALARDIADAAAAEERLDAAQSGARAAQSRARVAGSAAVVAQGTAPSKIAQSQSAADLAANRALTEEMRAQTLQRQQQNKDLETESRVALTNAKAQDLADKKAERAQQAQSKAAKQQQNDIQKATKLQAVQDAKKQKVAEEQGRLYNNYLEQQASGIKRISAQEAAATARQTKAQQKAIYQQYLDQQKAFDAHNSVGNINATRYALYGVAQTAAVVGGALTALGVGSVAVATKFQSSFSTVDRAAELTGSQVTEIRKQLIDLSEEVPSSFDDITKAATLGAQMGIAANDLAGFSKTIVEFSTTTNSSLDNTAESIGRISNLLDVPATKFNNLGSAIYQVGIKSVATETQILKMSEEIAGAASAYHFTADQVVGLSGAFASLAIAPEAARGSVTRIFGSIEKATTTGGPKLQAYAAILGTTEEKATALWKSDPNAFFTQLVDGLSKSKNLLTSLQSIGATNVRDVSLLQRLAGNPDVLNKSLAISAQAFQQGTALADGYAKKAATLASKIKELQNTFEALAATAGGVLMPVVQVVVTILTQLLKLLSTNSWEVGAIVLIATLVGGFILWKGAIAAAMGALLAIQFVLKSFSTDVKITGINVASLNAALLETREMAGLGKVSVGGLTTGVRGLGSAIKGLAKGTLILFAIQAAFEVLQGAVTSVNKTFESGSDKAKDFFGSTSGFSDAIAKDTAAYNAGGGAITTYTKKLSVIKPAAEDSTNAIQKLSGAQKKATTSTGEGSVSIEKQTIALGKNSVEWVKNQTLKDKKSPAFKDIDQIANDPKLLATFAKLGGNIDDLIAAGIKGKTADYIDSLTKSAYAKSVAAADQAAQKNGKGATDQFRSISTLLPILKDYSDNTNGLVVAQEKVDNSTKFLLGDNGKLAASSTTVAGAQQKQIKTATSLQDQLDQMFSGIKGPEDFINSLNALYQGLAEGGKSFSAFTQAGQTNIDNLEQSMIDTVNYGKTLGLNATQSVIPLFQQLQASGVDTTSLLHSLAADPIIYKAGIDISGVQKGVNQVAAETGAAGLGMKVLSNFESQGAANGKKLAAANNDVGSSASGATKEVRTLSDYVQDLSSAFQEAYDFRFGKQTALDAVNAAWQDIAKSQKEAQQNLIQYMADLQQLKASKDLQVFDLGVANAYGDTLEATRIQAEIAQSNSDISAKQNDINDAQNAASTTLVGNSAAAIANRQAITGLVQNYESLATAIENSTESDAKKRKDLANLKKDFYAQGQQLGFNKKQLDLYGKAFDDMADIIRKLPKNITVTADTNPAQRAIDDLIKKNTGGAGVSKGFKAPVTFSYDQGGLAKFARGQAIVAEIARIEAQIKSLQLGAPTDTIISRISQDASQIKKLSAQINSGKYATGGFVPWGRGNGGDNGIGLIAGTQKIVGLQGGEPIINNAARAKYGDSFFQAINAQKYQPVLSPTIVMPAAGRAGGNDDATMMMLMRALASRSADVFIDGAKVTDKTRDISTVRGNRGRRN